MTEQAKVGQVKKVKAPKKLSQSRPARWARAVDEGQSAFSEAQEAKATLDEAREEAKKRLSEEAKALDAAVLSEVDLDAKVEADEEVVAALAAFESYLGALNDALQALSDLKDEYQEWLDNLPESLQSGAMADKLNDVCDLDIETELDIDNFEQAEDALGECEGADLPLGFGKD